MLLIYSYQGSAGRLRHLVPVGRKLGQTKVQNLRVTALGHKDVGRLDIAVDDACRMSCIQGIRNFDSQFQHVLNIQWLTGNQVLERLALQVLHRNEGLPFIVSNLIDSADVGMVKSRGSPRLALETLKRLSLSCEFLGQELQRHVPAEFEVLSLIHHTHAATTEFPQNPIMRDSNANHDSPPQSVSGW